METTFKEGKEENALEVSSGIVPSWEKERRRLIKE